jgi:hypothetical protein
MLRRKPREAGDPIRIAIPRDEWKRGISPELPQLNRGRVLARQSAVQRLTKGIRALNEIDRRSGRAVG